jgi:hypothetical protein
MITEPIVFVLGAGSMTDYGFPIGWELVRDVITRFQPNRPERQQLLEHTKLQDAEIQAFVTALDGSAQNSVDAFLEERQDFFDVGIAAMSLSLIDFERPERLYEQRDPGGNWLRNMLQHMRGTGFDEFHTNKVSLVTFNYDRSLEYFLCRSLANTFNKTEEEAGAIINQMSIIHLHGQLGYLPWQGGLFARPYSPAVDTHALLSCTEHVKVVNRNTKVNDAPFIEARRLLQEAARVYFLGVGFNNENLTRLGVMDLAPNKAWSTCVGLRQREKNDLQSHFDNKLHLLINLDCIGLLRDTVIWK